MGDTPRVTDLHCQPRSCPAASHLSHLSSVLHAPRSHQPPKCPPICMSSTDIAPTGISYQQDETRSCADEREPSHSPHSWPTLSPTPQLKSPCATGHPHIRRHSSTSTRSRCSMPQRSL